MSARKPCRWATYPGDCRGNIGLVVGPTYDGREVLHVVSEDYDPATDRTRLGFAYGLPLPPEASPLVGGQPEHNQP